MLSLVFNNSVNLRLHKAILLSNEVGPGKLFFHSLVKISVLSFIGVCIQDMDGEPACSAELDDL